MKKQVFYLGVSFFLWIAAPLPYASAQLLKNVQKKLEKKLEKKVDDKTDEILDGKNAPKGTENNTSSSTNKMPNATYAFVAGKQLIFEYDMSDAPEGRMPQYWTTNSTGVVSTIPGESGKWLKVSNDASYQLDTLLKLPQRFTVEFDLLTRADDAADLRDMHFGFTKNPKPKNYIYGVSNDGTVVSTFLQFYYENIRTTSNDTNIENRFEFPLDNYGNAIIPIAMEIDGEIMRVYVDKQLVFDGEALKVESPKHFYFSNERPRNNAQVYLGRIRIAE